MVTDWLSAWHLACKERIQEVSILKTEESRKSNMAGPFISLSDLEHGQTVTLTSGTQMFPCTDFVDYVNKLSVQTLQ